MSKSKTLSYALRHHPEKFNLDMDNQGWVDVEQLLKNLKLTRPQLEKIVKDNDKKRFAFNSDQTKIRANQGHSVDINLNLSALHPPNILYHGTASRFITSIRKSGLHSGSRQHVHLTDDISTAQKVGSRHGKVVVLSIDCAKLQSDLGIQFYKSANGVWLVAETIPPGYIIF